jgi:hypothetical protein
MATTENLGAGAADIVPPCQRDRGPLCLTEFSLVCGWDGMVGAGTNRWLTDCITESQRPAD